MNSLDDLLKLLVDGEREAGDRNLNPTQKDFIYSAARFAGYKGPAGCAKTSTGCAKIFARALLEPGTKYLIGRHDYNDLMDTTALRMQEMLSRLPANTLLDRDKNPPMKWYIQPAAVRRPDGTIFDEPSQITFMGLKDGLGSYEFNGAFVDEAAEVEEQRVHEIGTRLRHRGGNYSVSLAFNPPDTNHWLYTACTGLDHTGRKVLTPWITLFEPEPKENVRNLPDGYYETMAQTLPEDMRQRLIDGMWGSTFPGDPVYRQFRRQLHVKDRLSFHAEGTLYRFWDFGYSRPACLWAQIDWPGRMYFLLELLGHQQQVAAFAQQVKTITKDRFPGAERILDYGDPNVRQKKDTGQALAILFNEGIQMRYQDVGFDISLLKVRKLFETQIEGEQAIQVDRRGCPILIQALSGGYHLKDDGVTPHKDGFYDHLADALRYGIINTLGGGATTHTNLPTSIAYRPEMDRLQG